MLYSYQSMFVCYLSYNQYLWAFWLFWYYCCYFILFVFVLVRWRGRWGRRWRRRRWWLVFVPFFGFWGRLWSQVLLRTTLITALATSLFTFALASAATSLLCLRTFSRSTLSEYWIFVNSLPSRLQKGSHLEIICSCYCSQFLFIRISCLATSYSRLQLLDPLLRF